MAKARGICLANVAKQFRGFTMATKLKTYVPLDLVVHQGQYELVRSALKASGLEHLVDQGMYWMHLLGERSCDHWKKDVGELVPVNAQLTRRLLAMNGEEAPMVDSLVRHGLVETTGSYCPGSRSREYRLAPWLTERPNECYGITGRLAETLRQAAEAVRAERHQDMLARLKCPRKVYDHLLGVHRQIKISPQARIDLDAADAEAKRRGCAVDYSYYFTLDSLERMGSMDDSELLIECAYSRLHSPPTRSWGGFRRYMTLNGESLASCDIKTSQPYILSVCFEQLLDMLDQAHSESHLVESITQYLDELVAPPAVRVALLDYMTQRFADRDFGHLRHDLDVFGGLASGDLDVDLYRYMMDLSGFEGQRDDFKATFFQSFYGEPRIARQLPTWQTVKKVFPALASEIDLAKSRDYRVLPRLMQMIEGRAVIRHVAPRLIAHGAPFFTLHDAVFSPASAITDVKTIMQQVLAECGLHPTLAVEHQQETREPKSRSVADDLHKYLIKLNTPANTRSKS